jgi:hypothetical protein
MLAEHGILVPVPTNEDDEYRLLLTAFGYWNLPLHFFEDPSTSASQRGMTKGRWTARWSPCSTVGTTQPARMFAVVSRTGCGPP